MSFLSELRRRNVFRVAALYVVAGWLLLQAADVLLGLLDIPAWGLRLVLAILVLGFPVALAVSWIYELTPEGVKRESQVPRDASITAETGRKLSLATTALLALAVIMLVVAQLSERSIAPTESTANPTPVGAASETPSGTATVRDRSVAVLPFVSRSNNEDDVFFADGMHDDLLTQLAKIANLKVISRTSVMEYRATDKKIPQIARELSVATVLEGAVQRSGNRVRINVQLIDAQSDEHLWAETYDRELTAGNIFEIQSEMARMVATALQATLSPEEEQLLQKPLTGDLAALEAYRRALWLRDNVTPESLRRAETELRYALGRDPGFATAHAVLAEVLLARFWFTDHHDTGLRDQAWDAIQRGRAADPEDSALDVAEGYYHYWGFLDYEAALEDVRRALGKTPNDARVIQLRAWIRRRANDFDGTLADLQRALELDPRHTMTLGGMGESLSWMRRPQEAWPYFKAALEIDPESDYIKAQWAVNAFQEGDAAGAAEAIEGVSNFDVQVPLHQWIAALGLGDFDRALAYSDFGSSFEGKQWIMLPDMMRGITLRLSGDAKGARDALERAREALERRRKDTPEDFRLADALCITYGGLQMLEPMRENCGAAPARWPKDAWNYPYWLFALSWGPALAGDHDRCLALLEKLLAWPSGPTALALRDFPIYRGLREDPRFQALVGKD